MKDKQKWELNKIKMIRHLVAYYLTTDFTASRAEVNNVIFMSRIINKLNPMIVTREYISAYIIYRVHSLFLGQIFFYQRNKKGLSHWLWLYVQFWFLLHIIFLFIQIFKNLHLILLILITALCGSLLNSVPKASGSASPPWVAVTLSVWAGAKLSSNYKKSAALVPIGKGTA